MENSLSGDGILTIAQRVSFGGIQLEDTVSISFPICFEVVGNRLLFKAHLGVSPQIGTL